MRISELKYGIIPALDESNPKRIERIVSSTFDIEGIVAYKVSGRLALRKGLEATVEAVKQYTEKPIILDYQKAGTDVPMMEKLLVESNHDLIDAIILFPESGRASQRALIEAAQEHGVLPIAGGHMTHPEYIEEEGGYIPERNVAEMYLNSALLGVNHFIVPANKCDVIEKYKTLLAEVLSEQDMEPVFAGPGIGRQGGDVRAAADACEPYAFYGIVGSAIRKAEDMEQAATKLCEEILTVE